jgi:hypothetical protein
MQQTLANGFIRLERTQDARPIRPDTENLRWRTLFTAGGLAAWGTVALVFLAIPAYLLNPPSSTPEGHFDLLRSNVLVALIGLDMVYVVSVALSGLVTLALYVALRRYAESAVTIATFVGLVSMVLFFSTNPAFSMLALSDQYATAATDAERSMLVAAGHAVLANQLGTAYFVHYYLGAVSGLILSVVMLRTGQFSRLTAYAGIVAYTLGLWPPVGSIGVAISLASVLVLVVWEILVGRRLLQVAGRA